MDTFSQTNHDGFSRSTLSLSGTSGNSVSRTSFAFASLFDGALSTDQDITRSHQVPSVGISTTFTALPAMFVSISCKKPILMDKYFCIAVRWSLFLPLIDWVANCGETTLHFSTAFTFFIAFFFAGAGAAGETTLHFFVVFTHPLLAIINLTLFMAFAFSSWATCSSCFSFLPFSSTATTFQ